MKKQITKYEYFESCRSCTYCFKDKSNSKNERRCAKGIKINTKRHVNQNGHVVKKVTSVSGVTSCFERTGGANKCRSYKRNPRKPLQKREK